jgi:hypothetical protein
MDFDDAAPPPIERIRRSPRAALEHQQALGDFHFDDYSLDVEDFASPENSPSENNPPSLTRPRTSSSSSLNPLRAHPVTPSARTANFSRPWAVQPPQEPSRPITAPAPPIPPPIPRRSPARLKSYRPPSRNKRLPPHLRRRVSLETIASVTTTASNASDEDDDQELDPPEAAAPSPDFFTLEDDQATTPVPTNANSPASSVRSSSVSSMPSSNLSVTPVNSADSGPISPKSLFQKLKHRKNSGPSGVPDRLVITRKVSVDRISHRSSLTGSPSGSNSNVSLPSERALESGLFGIDSRQSASRQSGSSSEWSASDFDINTLTEAEIKKCKKKGINPALYAEMKAARKGKWTSPIAGNSFL